MQDEMCKKEDRFHCRFCGKNKKIDPLLTMDETMLKCFIESMKLDNIIDMNCNILPKTLCMPCHKFLKECFNFIDKIKETQIYLSSIYKKSQDLLKIDIKLENDYDNSLSPKSDNTLNIINDQIIKEDPCPNSITQKGLKDTNSTIQCKSLLKDNLEWKCENSIAKNTLGEKRTVLKNNLDIEEKYSWTDYDWTCAHCEAKFKSMQEVRDHSKIVHAICFGFRCSDCEEMFNYFNPFIEHLRKHKPSLRYFCHFCNHKSPNVTETTNHMLSHWSTSNICTLCGEMLPHMAALERHNRAYKKAALPQRCYKKKPKKVVGVKSWVEYEWRCQDCGLRVPSIAALRAHSRNVHNKCFTMKCADCLVVLANYKQFIEHVTAHREWLKNYCPYCDTRLNDTDMESHLSTHIISGLQKPCFGCGEIFPDSMSLTEHKISYNVPRVRGVTDEESLTCGVCYKKFPSGFQLRNHKVIHNVSRERDQICHTCGKAFFDAKTLTNHIRTHSNKTEACEVCHKSFLTKQRLKVHISTHLELKQFVCNECGKKFRRKSQLVLHMASHSDALPFQCGTCGKRFRLQSYLKIHERQHTGVRPYTCEVCSETFNHWGNCNRHMLRKHGLSFAKTKITAQGKLDINRETGEAKKIEIGGTVTEWCQEMLKPKKRGRKKKVL